MTFAVTYSVHIVIATLSGMSHGLDRNAAITESLRINAWPVFLTTITTAIGFLSLNASDAPPFHVLGNFVASRRIVCLCLLHDTPASDAFNPAVARAARSC